MFSNSTIGTLTPFYFEKIFKIFYAWVQGKINRIQAFQEAQPFCKMTLFSNCRREGIEIENKQKSRKPQTFMTYDCITLERK